jgi:hypothetical protein
LPTWTDWFHAAGVDYVDVPHGLTFNTADHALDAASEGAGVLLAQNILAHDHGSSPKRPFLLSSAKNNPSCACCIVVYSVARHHSLQL